MHTRYCQEPLELNKNDLVPQRISVKIIPNFYVSNDVDISSSPVENMT